MHRRELALSPALAEELRQRLEQTVMQITEVIREEDVGHRAAERLGRLRELSAFPKDEPATGDVCQQSPKATVPKCFSHMLPHSPVRRP